MCCVQVTLVYGMVEGSHGGHGFKVKRALQAVKRDVCA